MAVKSPMIEPMYDIIVDCSPMARRAHKRLRYLRFSYDLADGRWKRAGVPAHLVGAAINAVLHMGLHGRAIRAGIVPRARPAPLPPPANPALGKTDQTLRTARAALAGNLRGGVAM